MHFSSIPSIVLSKVSTVAMFELMQVKSKVYVRIVYVVNCSVYRVCEEAILQQKESKRDSKGAWEAHINSSLLAIDASIATQKTRSLGLAVSVVGVDDLLFPAPLVPQLFPETQFREIQFLYQAPMTHSELPMATLVVAPFLKVEILNFCSGYHHSL